MLLYGMATGTSQGTKRKMNDILIDPETQQQIEDSKKSDRKFKCMSSIVDMYTKVLDLAFMDNPPTAGEKMAVDGQEENKLEEAANDITVGNYITSIIFTIHNICRQETKEVMTNMVKETQETSLKIHFKNKHYPIDTNLIKTSWIAILKTNGLEYKDFATNDSENWYGTMGPYLDMFSVYALRSNELRLGHNNMPITKIDTRVYKSFPVSKYGLSARHHVLLEGISFPPERKSSIVQSLGPMTSWLCMLRSEGIYRRKYASAVKRAMAHVPCIDDMIEITKGILQASEISNLTTLVAEILLLTTARQATRMFFPITIFSSVWKEATDKRQLCDFFSTTGAGGWYIYKKAMEKPNTFTIEGSMESEKAAQIVFHSIFGTYKEDLSILEQITNISRWFTREELGTCFRQQGSSERITKINLPVVKYYPKMSCVNQSGLLSGVYNQVVTVPCFSGFRTQYFDATFFEHIEKKREISTAPKSVAQIVNILINTLEELHVKRDNGRLNMSTTTWRDMASLQLNQPGMEVNLRLEGK